VDDEAEALALQAAELRQQLGSNAALDKAERAALAAQLAALEARGSPAPGGGGAARSGDARVHRGASQHHGGGGRAVAA
jgi:hypothetical protein